MNPHQRVTWRQLFKYLEERMIRDKLGCCGDLRYTMTFCQEHSDQGNKSISWENSIDWEKTRLILEECGGFCDCEVLLNVLGPVAPDMTMPTIREGRRGVC